MIFPHTAPVISSRMMTSGAFSPHWGNANSPTCTSEIDSAYPPASPAEKIGEYFSIASFLMSTRPPPHPFTGCEDLPAVPPSKRFLIAVLFFPISSELRFRCFLLFFFLRVKALSTWSSLLEMSRIDNGDTLFFLKTYRMGFSRFFLLSSRLRFLFCH